MLYHKTDYYIEVFEKNLKKFDEFVYSEKFNEVMGTEKGVNRTLNLKIINDFYIWRQNSEKPQDLYI